MTKWLEWGDGSRRAIADVAELQDALEEIARAAVAKPVIAELISENGAAISLTDVALGS